MRRRIIVVVRPPARMALYHRFDNPLFERLLARVRKIDGLAVILLPRTDGQARELESQGFGSMLWRGDTLDGRAARRRRRRRHQRRRQHEQRGCGPRARPRTPSMRVRWEPLIARSSPVADCSCCPTRPTSTR